ncbi:MULTISPECIES: TapB family protein [Niastella]|uniref:DUF3108 domain-containing protein n=1 Tax=Niastella soli TaxID=2821487 RepID=A0ABS3Z0K5_9BACT|nr:hypothetical protein [Niastella soli]MBO9203548.1 hypothetical protein [Niastella soli]
MRFLFALVLVICVTNSNGQTAGSHALMKKGAQLEYMAYNAAYSHKQALRMVFEVADVTDSAGSVFSTIVKKGFGIKDEQNDHYEKTIRLQCDGKNIFIPFDFYGADTTWFNDAFTSIIKRHLFHTAIAPIDPKANYIFPLALDGVTELSAATEQVKMTVTTAGSSPWGTKSSKKLEGETGVWIKVEETVFNIKDIKVTGKEKVTTPAGTFDCYIIGVDCDFKYNDMPFLIKYRMRYNTEVGLVKMETELFLDKRKVSGEVSIELISVKK